MSFLNRNDKLLDEAIAQVVSETPDPRQVEEAASRVWARLASGAVAASHAPAEAPRAQAADPASGSLHTCEDFQALIPASLRGELGPARALLVEDHTRSCIPCRRALMQAREGRTAVTSVRPAAKAPSRTARVAWMSLAAVLALGIGLGLWTLVSDLLVGGADMARIEAVEGQIYRVSGSTGQALAVGEAIDEGDDILTAKGSTALVRLADGSLIEMSERSSLSLDGALKGHTIELERGKVIVRAAEQRNRHLYVATKDALVSVTGTIFSVNTGTKGSRVSVVEGEVHVKQGKKDNVVRPGHQVTTHASVEVIPVAEEVAWSRHAKEYEQLLAELTALGQEIDARVTRPGLRYSTRLLDLVPAGTTIYIALPNLTASLSETHKILDERIAESPTLAKWWTQTLRSTGTEDKFRELIERIGDLGKNLGDEVAIALDAGQDDCEPLLLAEVKNQAAFRAVLEQEIAKINEKEGKTVLALVDDPANAPADDDVMLLWIHGDLFAASPSAQSLAELAARAGGKAIPWVDGKGNPWLDGKANPWVDSDFRNRIAQDYQDGAGWLFAADLKSIIGRETAGEPEDDRATAEQLGILDLQHFIIDRREIEGRAETRAALTFDRERRGIPAWLAAPAPMGGLSFFSPDANLAAAFVVRSPVTIVDEMLALNADFAAELAELEAEHGFNLRDDLAAPLGGEIAMAVDGPLLPTPSWKLVVEVYDPARFQATIVKAVARVNDKLREDGKPEITLGEETAGGRTYYSIVAGAPKIGVHYVFVDGYLVMGPSRALLERAIDIRQSGVTLATTPKFRDLLGPDGQVNVSALVYQNLGPLAESASKVLPGDRTQGKSVPSQISNYLIAQGPTLYYAYAEPDRIVFAGSNQHPLGLNLGTLAGLGNIVGAAGKHHPVIE